MVTLSGNSRFQPDIEAIAGEAGTERGSLDPIDDQNLSPQAPVAPRRTHSFTTHGINVVDDYAWLKDAKWQEVLHDPSILDADIRQYLESENDYTESLLGHTAPLQKKLVAEMRGRIKEDDSSVPAPDGPFAYLRKFREGGSTRCSAAPRATAAKPGSCSTGDALAANEKYLQVRRFTAFAPDHKLQAWSADTKGSEYFSIRVRDWETGADHDDLVEETDGTVVWSKDANSFFYVKLDRQSPADAGLAPSPWATSRLTICWSMRKRIPAGSPTCMRSSSGRFSADRRRATMRPPNSG